MTMTKAQEKAVERLRGMIDKDLFFGKGYEVKKFKVWKPFDDRDIVEVELETGKVGDEGTWAEIYCRERARLFVGVRGGVTYVTKKGVVKTMGKFESLYLVSYAQRYV